jgi:hypothetical protein
MGFLQAQLIAGYNTCTESLPATDGVAVIISDVPANAGKQLYRDIKVELQANGPLGCNPYGLMQVH